jgi:CHAT domain-containing protein/tetratricopeptide (TPR) repeat protein
MLRGSLGILMVLLTVAAIALADEPKPKQLTEEQKARLKERDRLDAEAHKLAKAGKPDQIIALWEKKLAIEREIFGDVHEEVISSLAMLALIHRAREDFDAALKAWKDVLTMRTKLYGEKDWRVADTRLDLADLERQARMDDADRQRLRQAEALNKRAVELLEGGRAREALPLAQQELAIHRELLGEGHRHYATSLNTLGMVYKDMGDYPKALSLLEQARGLFKQVLTENHPFYALSLDNLAMLYKDMGDYPKALPLVKQARDLHQKLRTDNDRDYAATLINLASLYRAMEDYPEALSLLEQARKLLKKLLTENHRDYAASLIHLASLYQAMEDYPKALSLLEQARDITMKLRTKNQSDYAHSLHHLGLLHEAMGDYPNALSLLEQARDLFKKFLTENDPNYAISLESLAKLYHYMGDHDKAATIARHALRSQQAFLDHTLAAMSDRQRLDLLTESGSYLDVYLTCLAPRRPAAAPQVYSDLLPWKAAAAARRAEESLSREHPDLRPLADQLRLAQASLARMAHITPTTPEQRDDWVKHFDAHEAEVERLERALAEKSNVFRRFRKLREAGAADVAAALPHDAALVDFVAYLHYTPAPKARPAYKLEVRLLAFVVRRGRDPVCVPLGRADEIPSAILAWRTAVLRGHNPDAAGAQLAALVWQPLTKYLGDAKTVLLAPDVPLAFVPFAALPGSKHGTYLVEALTFGYVTSGRHLLELADDAVDRPASAGLFALGGIDYGPRPKGSLAVAVKDDPRGLERGPDVNPHLFLQSAYWKPLPGTRFEAEGIVRAYRDRFRDGRAPLLLGGAEPDADRLRQELTPTKETPRWRYLHLATHGYFQPAAPKRPGARPDDLLGFDREFGVRTAARNPLLMSGLVLAGANRAPDRGTLSAQEASALDLRGAELVVLSACDTGLGKVAAGEGVLGLQRAFQMAGARTVVASLWKVNDAATSLLMEEFYTNLWQKKLSKLEALRKAQLTVLKNPALVRKRAEELAKAGLRAPEDAEPLPKAGPAEARSHPALWAAFVSYGDSGAEPEARK